MYTNISSLKWYNLSKIPNISKFSCFKQNYHWQTSRTYYTWIWYFYNCSIYSLKIYYFPYLQTSTSIYVTRFITISHLQGDTPLYSFTLMMSWASLCMLRPPYYKCYIYMMLTGHHSTKYKWLAIYIMYTVVNAHTYGHPLLQAQT